MFLIGWSMLVQSGLANLALFDGRMNVWFVVLHLLGFIGLIGVGVAIWNAWLSLQGSRGWWSKIVERRAGGVLCRDHLDRVHV